MPDTVPVPPIVDPTNTHQLRRGRLGVVGVAFFVISAAAPLTAMAGGAPVAMLLGNGEGLPFAYVIVSLLLLIFAVGYTAMARHHTSTGAFYSYVARGLRQKAGGSAAIIALLGYNAMQIGLYGLFGAATAGFCADSLGLDLPWYVYVFLAMALIAVIGYRQVDLSPLPLPPPSSYRAILMSRSSSRAAGGSSGLSGSPFTPAPDDDHSAICSFNSASFIGFRRRRSTARKPRSSAPSCGPPTSGVDDRPLLHGDDLAHG